jgi:hypothetical protein
MNIRIADFCAVSSSCGAMITTSRNKRGRACTAVETIA